MNFSSKDLVTPVSLIFKSTWLSDFFTTYILLLSSTSSESLFLVYTLKCLSCNYLDMKIGWRHKIFLFSVVTAETEDQLTNTSCAVFSITNSTLSHINVFQAYRKVAYAVQNPYISSRSNTVGYDTIYCMSGLSGLLVSRWAVWCRFTLKSRYTAPLSLPHN